jgi:hypothetical protein
VAGDLSWHGDSVAAIQGVLGFFGFARQAQLAEHGQALFQVTDRLGVAAHSLVGETELEQAQRVVPVSVTFLKQRDCPQQALSRQIVLAHPMVGVGQDSPGNALAAGISNLPAQLDALQR